MSLCACLLGCVHMCGCRWLLASHACILQVEALRNQNCSCNPGLFCDALPEYTSPLQELPALLAAELGQQLNISKASISGHSMGGHGALTIALKNPQK